MSAAARTLALLCFFSLSCAGRCACVEPKPEFSASMPRLAGSLRWAVSSSDRSALELRGEPGRLAASGGGASLRWVAVGQRGEWMHDLSLALDLNRLAEGPSSLSLTSSRCRVRYLREGRETEADFAVSEATVTGLSFDGERWMGELDLTCEKLVQNRSDGEPYAAQLPERFRVQGTAWAR